MRGTRKGWSTSFILHALLVLICFLTFMAQDVHQDEIVQSIAIQFETSDFEVKPVEEKFFEEGTEGSSKQSGAEADAAASESGIASASQAPREQVAVSEVSRIQPSTTMSAPARTITTVDPAANVVLPTRTNTQKSDRFFDQPVEVTEQYEIDRVEAFSAKPNPLLQQKVTWHVSDNESSEEGRPTSYDFGKGPGTGTSGKGSGNGTGGSAPDGSGEDAGYDPFGDGTFPGGTGTGTGNKGNDTGVGNEGTGLSWGDFAGDGLFTRKVIRRAPVAQIADLPGKIVVNLCVDQLGKVVFAQFDSPNSTIRSKVLAAKAEEYAKMYLFDEDPSAPREQCGKLTFIFEIKK